MTKIPITIRQARVLRNMKQYELAERVGRSSKTICMYEKGKLQIPSKVLEKIMEELDIELIIKAA